MTALWPEIMPLIPERNLPVFPVALLPVWVRDEVLAVAATTQTPVDLPATVSLGTLSAMTVGRLTVQVRSGWSETVNLYVAVAADPGSRKSAVYNLLTAPLYAAEAALRLEVQAALTEQSFQRDLAGQEAERLKKAAGAKGAKAETLAEAIGAAMKFAAMTLPTVPRLLADDLTPEALGTLLAEHGTIAVLSAEGGGLSTLTGVRYSERAHLDVILKAHTGDALSIDRKSSTPLLVPHPVTTICVTVQPRVLADLVATREFRERGLVARVLAALPVDTVGQRPFDGPPIDRGIEAAWTDRVQSAAQSFYGSGPICVAMSNEAVRVLKGFHDEIEPQLALGGELAHTYGWGGKAVGAAARIAALLHVATLLDDGPLWRSKPISATSVEAGVGIVRYFKDHQLALWDNAALDDVTRHAMRVLAWIGRHRLTRFTRRDAHNALFRTWKAKEVSEVLDRLVEHNYIRRAPELEPGTKGGRPAIAYDVNPTHAYMPT